MTGGFLGMGIGICLIIAVICLFNPAYENGTLAFKQIDHLQETASETAAFELPEDPPHMMRLPQIFENDPGDGSQEAV